MTVLSFPGPDRSIQLDQLRAGRAVSRRYRNRRIGEFLKELDLTEGRATGIPKILRAMADNGSPAPEFETDEDRISFLVRLPVHPEAARWAPGTEGEEELKPESESSRPKSRPESEGARPESRLESEGSRLESEEPRLESGLESEPEWRSRSEWRAAWKPGSVHDRVMAAISREPLSRSKIAKALGHTSTSGAVHRAIADLMQSGLIEITIPDKPNSRLQRYRITGVGRGV